MLPFRTPSAPVFGLAEFKCIMAAFQYGVHRFSYLRVVNRTPDTFFKNQLAFIGIENLYQFSISENRNIRIMGCYDKLPILLFTPKTFYDITIN